MDWFEKLTGFRETHHDETRARLEVEGRNLRSIVNGACYGIGALELVSLQDLRERAISSRNPSGKIKVNVVQGNIRSMHQSPENAGALFQVASQFNLLEMVSPDVTPEQGVTRYQNDPTQGPACAIAAGAATIYRNYFTPVDGSFGQTAERQLNGLADLGVALSSGTKLPVGELWKMKNGYALASQDGLEAINEHFTTLTKNQIDNLRSKLRVGLHRDVEVTEASGPDRPHVSQLFCSAMPVAYTDVPSHFWQPLASLVLEAAYEATAWATLINSRHGASNVVFMTLLGGSAFGNDKNWIYAAMIRALELMRPFAVEVKLVSYGAPSRELIAIAKKFSE